MLSGERVSSEEPRAQPGTKEEVCKELKTILLCLNYKQQKEICD